MGARIRANCARIGSALRWEAGGITKVISISLCAALQAYRALSRILANHFRETAMRLLVLPLAATLFSAALPAAASAQSAVMKTFAANADIPALIAKAKA